MTTEALHTSNPDTPKTEAPDNGNVATDNHNAATEMLSVVTETNQTYNTHATAMTETATDTI